MELKVAKKQLKSKQRNAVYQRKFRSANKVKLLKLSNQFPELQSQLKPGQLSIEEKQSGILSALIYIAIIGSAAHDRRRTEEIISCKTLDDLREAILLINFQISRTALYYRLIPRNSTSIAAKRHVTIVPVRLCRAQNDNHKSHPDTNFCVTSIRYLESSSSFFGLKQVCFLSQDDKARVPLGLSAANKQSPMLMHVEYRVKLMYHDFVVGNKHKLIPSVYAGIMIKPMGFGALEAVTFSGPTYISIRSAKHDSSSAEGHHVDLHRLAELLEFEDIMKINGLYKPVFVISSDGGPDENPR